MSIFLAIIVFSVIVIIHEIGHYVAARTNGILVEEFAIGMGPKIFSFEKKGTIYSLRLFPIGGFCKMLGEDASASDETGEIDERSFNAKKIYQRFIVLFAGVFFNVVLAFIVFTLLVMTSYLHEPVVWKVVDGSPAQAAGLQPGDRVIRSDGTIINIYEDLSYALGESGGKPVNIVILRNGQKLEKTVTPVLDETGRYYVIGFNLNKKIGLFKKAEEGFERAGFFESIANGFWRILFYIKVTLLSIVKLFTFNLSFDQMSGPIGIVGDISNTFQSAVTSGISSILFTMAQYVAVLSANLGVFNLLPIPALDGGRILFLVIEAIRRKPIPPEKEGMVHFAGFVLLMAFTVFVAYNDIMKLFG